MIKLSAVRKRAYFAGVDFFCKESCFDAADTAAMRQLIEKFGYISRPEEPNPLAFMNLPQPPPRPTYGPGVRLPGDPVKKTGNNPASVAGAANQGSSFWNAPFTRIGEGTYNAFDWIGRQFGAGSSPTPQVEQKDRAIRGLSRPAKPAAPAPSRSMAARPTPAAAPTTPAAGGAKFPGQISGAQPGSQARTAPAFAGPTPIGPTKGMAQPAGTSPYIWPGYDPSGRIQPTPGLPQPDQADVDMANNKWEVAKRLYVSKKRLGEDPVRAANLALQEAGMPARFQEFVNMDPDLQKLMGAPRSPGMRVGTAVPPAEQASSMGTAEQAPAQQTQARVPAQQTQAQVPAQQTQAQVPARRNRAKWTATGSIEGGPTMTWYGPGGPAEPRRTVG